MKKTLLIISLFLTTQLTFASGIGYVDFAVVYKTLPISVQYQKRMDIKANQVRAYNQATKKLVAAQKTQEEKEKIKNSRKQGLYKLEKEYIDLSYKQDTVVREKIKAASDIVLAKKKLDAIIDKKSVVSGGIDCTQEVLKAVK